MIFVSDMVLQELLGRNYFHNRAQRYIVIVFGTFYTLEVTKNIPTYGSLISRPGKARPSPKIFNSVETELYKCNR